VAEGTPCAILDGKTFDADRCHEKTASRKGREIDLWYSGKKKDFGGNIQAVFYPDGRPMRASDVIPGNVNDLSAAREMVFAVISAFTAELPVLADGGYEGAGHGILIPVKKPKGN
jgi:DDE superfamily endonuclease